MPRPNREGGPDSRFPSQRPWLDLPAAARRGAPLPNFGAQRVRRQVLQKVRRTPCPWRSQQGG